MHSHVTEALQILIALGMPRGQQNERTAYCLLALLNLTPDKRWADAQAPYIGITPMMEFSLQHYGKEYAPNSRETFRRQSIHQLVDAGIALYNPDDPGRAVNSPKAVYQIEPNALELLRTFGSQQWDANLEAYLSVRKTLAKQYANEREQQLIPVQIAPGVVMAACV